MRSAHLVDRELLPLLDVLPAAPVDRASLDRVRTLPPAPVPIDPTDGVTVACVGAPGADGAPPVPLRVYTPSAAGEPRACILHFHGGGYVMGAAANHEAAHRRLVADLGCVIVSADYRLAPETVFPGAVEDGYAALAWVHANAAAHGIDAARIGVMGESAGGGLAAALALLARDRRAYPIAFQHLIYPMLDDRTCLRDVGEFAGELVWTPESNRFGWESLFGRPPGAADVSPYAAPARAADLGRLPQTFIATGALDLFVEEDIEYARRLITAGVPVELHVYPGAFHVFDLMPGARVSTCAQRDSFEALRRVLA